MDNNAAYNLAGMMRFAENFVKNVESGEGFNLTDEQKVEYKKKYEEMGVGEKINEAKKKLEELKNIPNNAPTN